MVQNLNFYVYYTGIGDNKIDHKYDPVDFICLINENYNLLNNFNKKQSKVPILNPNYFTNKEFEDLIEWTGGIIIQEF